MAMTIAKSALAAALAGGLLLGTAQAYEAGDWLLRGGIYGVFPKSDNLTLGPPLGPADLDVDDGYSFGFNVTYMATPNIGIELLAAWPFSHDLSLTGAGTVGETKHLPPTLSVQYHFMPTSNIRPYAGLGLNFTTFFDTDAKGALRGQSLKLENSWGVAVQLGIDIDVAPNWFVNADLRYIDIESDAKLNGVGIGTVEIDPIVFGLNIGTRF